MGVHDRKKIQVTMKGSSALREVTWCFTPSQPIQLYQGEHRVKITECKTGWAETSWVSCFSLKIIVCFSFDS